MGKETPPSQNICHKFTLVQKIRQDVADMGGERYVDTYLEEVYSAQQCLE